MSAVTQDCLSDADVRGFCSPYSAPRPTGLAGIRWRQYPNVLPKGLNSDTLGNSQSCRNGNGECADVKLKEAVRQSYSRVHGVKFCPDSMMLSGTRGGCLGATVSHRSRGRANSAAEAMSSRGLERAPQWRRSLGKYRHVARAGVERSSKVGRRLRLTKIVSGSVPLPRLITARQATDHRKGDGRD